MRELHERLDGEGIARKRWGIRSVTAEGFAGSGAHGFPGLVKTESANTPDSAWQHVVEATDPGPGPWVSEAPPSLVEVFGLVGDILQPQDGSSAAAREVFRCA